MYRESFRILFYTAIALMCIIANIVALTYQFWYHELPCPLCLLQRFGFLSICYGAILSLRSIYSESNSRYKYDWIIVISSLFTLLTSLRQVLLHVVPQDPGYGSTMLGMHLYTWSAITSFALIVIVALLPSLNVILDKLSIYLPGNLYYYTYLKSILVVIVFINVVANYLECGFTMCPADPKSYQYLP